MVSLVVVFGFAWTASLANAQSFSTNFGPLIDNNIGPSVQSVVLNVAPAIATGTNATLSLTLQGDLENNFVPAEQLFVTIDGVPIGTVGPTGNDCETLTPVFSVSSAVIAPLIADGQLVVAFTSSSTVSPNQCINPPGPFAGNVFAFAVQGSLTYGNGFTTADRSIITDGLLNSFLQADGGIFETDGISIFGLGGQATNGISLMPNALSLGTAQQLDDPFYRRFGGAPRSGPFNTQSTTNNTGFNFRVDLNGLRAHARANAASPLPGQALALGTAAAPQTERLADVRNDSDFQSLHLAAAPGQTASLHGYKTSMKDGPVAVQPRFNAWASGRYVDFDDDQQNADRSGHIWRVSSGMSYRVNDQTMLGAFGRIRQGEAESTALRAKLDSDFYGAGVFGVFQTLGGLRVLASGLYEFIDSDIDIDKITGSFDAEQWTVEAHIDKRFTRGRHWIEPTAKIFYTELDRDAYTDSSGAQIAGSKLTLGRVTYGPTIGTTIKGSGELAAEYRPFAKVEGIWDFESEGDFTVSTGSVFTSAETGITVGGGMEVAFIGGTNLVVSGDWFNFDSELEGWRVKGGMTTTLASLGLGGFAPNGLVSLNIESTADVQTAKAKVTIPLI